MARSSPYSGLNRKSEFFENGQLKEGYSYEGGEGMVARGTADYNIRSGAGRDGLSYTIGQRTVYGAAPAQAAQAAPPPPPVRSTGEYNDIIGSLKVDQASASAQTAQLATMQTQQQQEAALAAQAAALGQQYQTQQQAAAAALTQQFQGQIQDLESSYATNLDDLALAYNTNVAEYNQFKEISDAQLKAAGLAYDNQATQFAGFQASSAAAAEQQAAEFSAFQASSAAASLAQATAFDEKFSAYQTQAEAQLAISDANYQEQAKMVGNLQSAFVPEANPNAFAGTLGDQRADDDRPRKSNSLSSLSSLSIVSGLGTASNPLSGLQLA